MLRQTTGLSIGDIGGAIKNCTVLKSYVLYENNRDEAEYEFLRLLHEVPNAEFRHRTKSRRGVSKQFHLHPSENRQHPVSTREKNAEVENLRQRNQRIGQLFDDH